MIKVTMQTIRLASIFLILNLSACTMVTPVVGSIIDTGAKALKWYKENAKPHDSESSEIQGEWTALASTHKFNFQTATNGYYSVTGSGKPQNFLWTRTGKVVNVNDISGRAFVFSLVNGKLKGSVDDKVVELVKSDS